MRVKTLFLIRHAESQHNQKDMFKATHPEERHFVNTCLTEEGKRQAGFLEGPCEVLIVSPLKRALETYIYSRLTVRRIVVTDLAREWKGWGPAQFLELEDQSAVESPRDFEERINKLVEFIKQLPEENVTLLSHGGVLCELSRRFSLDGVAVGWSNAQVRRFDNIVL